MSNFSLEGKTALITGGGSGIGKAIAMRFFRQGARVYILENNKQDEVQTTGEVTGNEGEVIFYQCDVTNQVQVKNVIAEIAENETIDILINNAGVAHVGNVENTSEEDLDRIYQVNVKGVYNCIYAVIPYMKKQQKGCIINMASIASVVGVADRFAYSMSKGAALTMTYSVAKDYLEYGIRCNSISPARIHTPFVDGFIAENYPGKEEEMFDILSKTQPIGRMGQAEEVANMAVYLCSDEASFITGTNFPIDGGFIKLNG